MQIRQNLTKLSQKTVLRAGEFERFSTYNTSSGNFEVVSMGASHLDDILKLAATKLTQIG